MKTRNLLTIIACMASCAQTLAQTTPALIKGRVTDEYDKALEIVSVSLLKAADSNLVKAAITDSAGNFEIAPDKEGEFLLSYSLMGYKSTFSAPFMLEPGQGDFVALGIKLVTESQKIKDVVITSTKPMIEASADKIVFNVEGSINATGSNALELLQKSPGIMVDNNDNISMRGKNGVKIYIDGKMTQLDSKSLADYLKSINSSDIEAIEMIANPGAKYDASGNAGIVNIRLKKNKKFGTNGSADLGIIKGNMLRGNGSVSLNYRDKKVNIFSNISGAAGDNRNYLDLYRTQNDTLYRQHSIMTNNWKNANIKAGADYFLDSKSTLGVLILANFKEGSFTSENTTDILLPASERLLKTIRSSNNVPLNRINTNFNLNYRYTDTSGTEISFDADYGRYHSTGKSYQPNDYYDAGNSYLYSIINGNRTPTDIDIYTAKLDLEHKLGKGKLGYGAKVAFVKTNNAFEFFNYYGDDVPVKDLSLSNGFVYTENVNAAYVNYDRTLSIKWSFKAGLRMEQTNSKGELTRADGMIQPDNVVERSYLDFFPNAALTFNMNESNVFGLVYSRRIDRPGYQDLNPFENKLDQLTYEKGNAFLKPQYTDNVELNYAFKSILNAAISYSRVRDYAARVTDTINSNATFLQSRNIALQQIFGFSIGSALPIAKRWNGYVNFWYNYQIIDGGFNNTVLDIRASGYGAYMQHTFKLGKDYTAEVSGWFNGNGLEGTWRQKAIGAMDIGIKKQFLQDRATIKVSFSNVFNTIRFRATSDYGGTYMIIDQRNDTRFARVNFSYRFGNKEVKGAHQRKTASESEGSRIK